MKCLTRLLLMLCLVPFITFYPAISRAASRSGDTGPITIAAIFSQTGLAALHNRPLLEMVELTVDKLNREGGVLGRQLEVLVLDNKSTPIGALEAARQAIAADVTAVIGGHWSSHSLAMAPELQAAGIPMIAPASTHPDMTRDRDYVFRVCFVDSTQGQSMARFALNNLGARTTAVLRNIDEQYSNTLGEYFRSAFSNLGGKVVLDAGYRGKATDFSSIIKQLQILQPETIYIPGYTRDTALFMKQARGNGITATFLGGDGWDMLGRFISEVVEGSYQSVPWHPDVPYAEGRVVQSLYEKTHDAPIENMTTPLAYDSVMLLVEAIRKAGGTDPGKIREALAASRNFQGATGPISFDEHGDPRDKEVIIVKYVKGKTVFVTALKSLM